MLLGLLFNIWLYSYSHLYFTKDLLQNIESPDSELLGQIKMLKLYESTFKWEMRNQLIMCLGLC